MLSDLAAHERAAGPRAAVCDPADDVGHALGHDLAAGDVVVHEQRLGAADHQVVDDHADQVEADGVVLVERLRDHQLGADPVGGRRQHRPTVALRSSANRPAKPPRSPSTSGRRRSRRRVLSSATARSPASMSTPADAYVAAWRRISPAASRSRHHVTGAVIADPVPAPVGCAAMRDRRPARPPGTFRGPRDRPCAAPPGAW